MRENRLAMYMIVFILGMLFGVAFHQVAHGQERMDGAEWECRALPPEGTKFRDAMQAYAIHEDKSEAEKAAVWLCNKLFKTDKCKVDRCRQVRKRTKA